jgi:hypothetical protein
MKSHSVITVAKCVRGGGSGPVLLSSKILTFNLYFKSQTKSQRIHFLWWCIIIRFPFSAMERNLVDVANEEEWCRVCCPKDEWINPKGVKTFFCNRCKCCEAEWRCGRSENLVVSSLKRTKTDHLFNATAKRNKQRKRKRKRNPACEVRKVGKVGI